MTALLPNTWLSLDLYPQALPHTLSIQAINIILQHLKLWGRKSMKSEYQCLKCIMPSSVFSWVYELIMLSGFLIFVRCYNSVHRIMWAYFTYVVGCYNWVYELIILSGFLIFVKYYHSVHRTMWVMIGCCNPACDIVSIHVKCSVHMSHLDGFNVSCTHHMWPLRWLCASIIYTWMLHLDMLIHVSDVWLDKAHTYFDTTKGKQQQSNSSFFNEAGHVWCNNKCLD